MYSIIFQAIIDSERPKPNFVVGRTIKESSQKCTQSNFEESGTARAIFVVGQKILEIMYSMNFEKSERPDLEYNATLVTNDDVLKGNSFLKCVVSKWALPEKGGV